MPCRLSKERPRTTPYRLSLPLIEGSFRKVFFLPHFTWRSHIGIGLVCGMLFNAHAVGEIFVLFYCAHNFLLSKSSKAQEENCKFISKAIIEILEALSRAGYGFAGKIRSMNNPGCLPNGSRERNRLLHDNTAPVH